MIENFINHIENVDVKLFFLINHSKLYFLDDFFYLISQKYFWLPILFILFILIRRKIKKYVYIYLFLALLNVFFSDQISNFIKKRVKRYRPTHNLVIKEKVRTIREYKGGLYGFVSSHASNFASICVFLIKTKVLSNLNIVFVISVFLVSYSRVHLGVHFPSDIVGGWLLGIIIGVITSKIWKKVEKNLNLK